jgi:hypothetical protein
MAEDDLLVRLRELFRHRGEGQSNFGVDQRVGPALAILVEAVLKLDKTSTELATANIKLTTANVKLTRVYTWLTAALLFIGIVQIVVMVRGR